MKRNNINEIIDLTSSIFFLYLDSDEEELENFKNLNSIIIHEFQDVENIIKDVKRKLIGIEVKKLFNINKSAYHLLLKEYATIEETKKDFLLDEITKESTKFLKEILEDDIKNMSQFIFIDGNKIITFDELKNYYYLKQFDYYSIEKERFYYEEMNFYHHFRSLKDEEINLEAQKYKEFLILEHGICGEKMFQYFVKEYNNNTLIAKYN